MNSCLLNYELETMVGVHVMQFVFDAKVILGNNCGQNIFISRSLLICLNTMIHLNFNSNNYV